VSADELEKPEEKLRLVRLRAQSFFEQLHARETAMMAASALPPESVPINTEQLHLFLCSLHAHLLGAIAEVQESSRSLAELAAEVRQVKARRGY